MKKFSLIVLLALLISGFKGDEGVYSPVMHNSYKPGERLDYKLRMGIFTVGQAEMLIDDRIYEKNNRPCHKIDIYGRTASWISWISKVEDQWGAYVDKEAVLPHMTYRNIREGRYRKNEEIYFDHEKNEVEAKVINRKTGFWKPSEYYPVPENVRDMISGLVYLRTIDFSGYQPGDKIRIDAFFEDAVYDFFLVFKKREVIKTKLGQVNAIKLVPEMPENDIFDGENSVIVWISDDPNHIPLKFEAKMFLGSAGVDITDYSGLLHPINFADN
jgi:hypothetical protein